MKQRRPRLGFLVKTLHQAFRAHLEAALQSLGLSLSQLGVLTALRQAPGASSAELARAAFITPQSMGEILRTLQETGLIARQNDPGNARIRQITLTPTGLRTLAAADREIEIVEGRIRGGLSPAQWQTLCRLLEACTSALRTQPGVDATVHGGIG